MDKRIPLVLPIVLGIVLLTMFIPGVVEFYTDLIWAEHVGYEQIFLKSIATRAGLGLGCFVVIFGLLLFNFRMTFKTFPDRQTYMDALRMRGGARNQRGPYIVIDSDSEEEEQGPELPFVLGPAQVKVVAVVAAGVISALIGLFASSQWLYTLKSLNATSFGENEPIFGRDVSFYVFHLPFYDFLQGTAIAALGLALVGSGILYVQAGAVSIQPREGVSILPQARKHLSVLVGLIFLALAVGAYLREAYLLISPSGIVFGASYVDVHARLIALQALAGASVIGCGLSFYQAFSGKSWPVLGAVGLYLVVTIAGQAYASAIQRFVVTPNEQVKETPYIIHNIEATRKAFALDRVEERFLSGDERLTRDDIEQNTETLRNVRLWDHKPLLDTFGQIQEIRTYYDFVSVDNDRYLIDGKYRQIMLSARELNKNSLPNRSWINERLTFTHGYGIALGPVNQVTQEGLPVLFVKNLPPVSSVDLKIDEPSIYYGELTHDHVFVKTRAQEFHYPRGDDNVYKRYEGTGGVQIGGFLRKVLFAIRFGSLKLLLSNDLDDESRVMFRRRVGERVEAIAPFLDYDSDPYLVVSDGRLFWILDAYTTSNRYPYSAPPERRRINYIRNSVKVVIDAYNGSVDFYLADSEDPIARTLEKIFPGMFRPLEQMPEDLRRHIRYPEGIFALQTEMYSTYHMTNPAVFYNKEDQWEVASLGPARGNSLMEPYYTIMSLPGEDKAEFIQMLPFTPRLKDNLAAWMVARSDTEHYGELEVFQFPKQKVVFGPKQIIARIDQDQVISPQLTLWNQQGSEVERGTLLVIPIEESLLYIQPLYLRSKDGKIPELKRVIVAYQNQIVMEKTLDDALDRLFGRGARVGAQSRVDEGDISLGGGSGGSEVQAASAEVEGSVDTALETSASRARQHYQRAIAAQREGNWALYGEELEKLGAALDELAKEDR